MSVCRSVRQSGCLLETSTPGVQRCVHMRLSLLRMMQYCINLLKWCNDLRYFQDSMHFHHSQLDHHGPTDQPTDQPTDRRTDKASYRDAWTHLKNRKTIFDFFPIKSPALFHLNCPVTTELVWIQISLLSKRRKDPLQERLRKTFYQL